MGKKPVVALVGLIWAGVLASGCGECCRSNTRKGVAPPPPPMMSKNARNDGSPTGLVSDKDAPPPRPKDLDSPVVPASAPGKQVSANLSNNGAAPISQQSLTPRQHPGFASGSGTGSESVISRAGDSSARMPMPAPPVSARSMDATPPSMPASTLGDSAPSANGRLPELNSSAPPDLPPARPAPQSHSLPPIGESSSVPPPPPPSSAPPLPPLPGK